MCRVRDETLVALSATIALRLVRGRKQAASVMGDMELLRMRRARAGIDLFKSWEAWEAIAIQLVLDSVDCLDDGRIYYVSRTMGTYVVAAKPEYELMVHNVIEDDRSVFNGSPAVSGEAVPPQRHVPLLRREEVSGGADSDRAPAFVEVERHDDLDGQGQRSSTRR
jgi:hypothetical protein